MNFYRRARGAAVLCGLGFLLLNVAVLAQEAELNRAENGAGQELRDGSHDFDFNFGVWHTHITRVLNPLTGADRTMVLDGTVTVRRIWGGRAQLEEIEADGPKGHWEGLTLFLYNPEAHQWSQTFIASKSGELAAPTVGEFKDGRGELYANDTFDGRTIVVRGVWSDIKPDSHSYTESYSVDGGATWHPAFIAKLTREKQSGDAGADPVGDDARIESHDFDFDLGTWKTHSTRMLHPLTGSNEWVTMDGYSVVKKVWGGKADLAEYTANGSAGKVTLMALRWYNPQAREWNIDFATPRVGVLGAVPGVGGMRDGRMTFYDVEPYNGRQIMVRFEIWPTGKDTAESEQAFSDDGGKTWEVNWKNTYERVSSVPGEAN